MAGMHWLSAVFLVSVACSSPREAAHSWPVDLRPAVVLEEPEEFGGGEPAEAEEPDEYRNLTAVFVGYTTERGEGGATLGLEYERRVNSWLGLGAFGEVVYGDHPASAFGGGVYLRPTEKFAFVVMPAIEFQNGQSGEFMLRAGAIYDLWQSGRTILVPAVYVDLFRDTTAFVLGFSLAWEF